MLVSNTRKIQVMSSNAGCLDLDYQQTSNTCIMHLGHHANEEKEAKEAVCDEGYLNDKPVETKPNKPKEESSSKPLIDYLEFNALSESVRGRVKFESVVAAYEVIEKLFILKNCRLMKGLAPDAVPLKDLHNNDALVMGRSGEQVLNSLRVMGLINMNKEGVLLVRQITNKEKLDAKAMITQMSRSQY
jgi:hypothetical protein